MVNLGLSNNNGIIVTEKGEYKKPSVSKQVGGTIAGFLGYQAVNKGIKLLFRQLEVSDFSKYNRPEYLDVFDKVYEDSGLKEKGVKIINVTKENRNLAEDLTFNTYPKIVKKLYYMNKGVRTAINFSTGITVRAIEDGQNAAFLNNNNILINKAKFAVAGFHEMGHAINHHSFPSNLLQKGKYLRLAVPLIAGVSLLTRKKADGEQPKNKFDKALSFVRKHAVSLTGLACLPLMLEEGSASYRGLKMASPHLSKDLTKNLLKSQLLGYLSHSKVFYSGMVAVGAGILIKNMISSPKKISNNIDVKK